LLDEKFLFACSSVPDSYNARFKGVLVLPLNPATSCKRFAVWAVTQAVYWRITVDGQDCLAGCHLADSDLSRKRANRASEFHALVKEANTNSQRLAVLAESEAMDASTGLPFLHRPGFFTTDAVIKFFVPEQREDGN
jgi:hypothetical protein